MQVSPASASPSHPLVGDGASAMYKFSDHADPSGSTEERRVKSLNTNPPIPIGEVHEALEKASLKNFGVEGDGECWARSILGALGQMSAATAEIRGLDRKWSKVHEVSLDRSQ